MNKAISVSQLNMYLKSLIDSDENLKRLFIVGEISNFTNHYKSGHMYMSLKDEKSLVKAVMFSAYAKRLKFKPEEGMKVLVRGRVSVYEGSGQYQVYIEDMQPDGIGALNLAFNQLYDKLKLENLFSDEYKKQMPRYPSNIAVITSPTGAAVRDIFSIAERRWPLAKINFYPCTVQGENAAPELIKALNLADNTDINDVIIIGRGGGSAEDLWEFNNESLARRIFASSVPIVSAVGHENDYTICDYVADLRAPTPSAAVEMLLPDINEEYEKVKFFTASIKSKINYILEDKYLKLDNISDVRSKFDVLLRKKEEKTNFIVSKFKYSADLFYQKKSARFKENAAVLESLSPIKVLSRGYSVVKKENKSVKSIFDINDKDEIEVIFEDGRATLVAQEVVRHEKRNEV